MFNINENFVTKYLESYKYFSIYESLKSLVIITIDLIFLNIKIITKYGCFTKRWKLTPILN